MRDEERRLIKVLIVGDNHIIRSGLRRILDYEPSIRVLGDVSVEKARDVNTIVGQHPDLVLVDLDCHDNDVLEFIGRQASKKGSAVLLLSDLTGNELARKALSLGAAGVVLKIQPPAVLIAAIQDLCPRYSLASKSKALATGITQPQNRKFVKPSPQKYPADAEDKLNIDSLTTREIEVIRLIALGLKNKEIANRLSISDITVRHHLTSIFCKLEVSDRQKLLILAHRHGLADLTLHAESA